MTSIKPPEQPQRRIEIVPLLAAESPSAPPVTDARGAWREPTADTSVHEVAPFPSRPDLTQRLWVVSPATSPEADQGAPGSQSRLRALLLRERTALMAVIDDEADADARRRVVDRDAAPFPMPSAPMRDGRPRRTPKPRRADGAGRPLAADVAAAIARATGHEQPPPPAPSLSLVRRITARDRLDIVPFDEPPALTTEAPTTDQRERPTVIDIGEAHAARGAEAPSAPEPAPNPVRGGMIDLRERRRLRNRSKPAYLCPACDRKGTVDLIDQVAGLVSASCPRCHEMWTAQIHPDHATTDPR
jgi:hypothetical protein